MSVCGGGCSGGAGGMKNRPGLSSLRYRAGAYASFLQAMEQRLSGSDLRNIMGELPLATLTTRDPNDAAMALLDAWAVVGDVLTFYQERIANEGYLRTAIERSSVLALAGLVGYRAKPGVSASVYLAYTMESGSRGTIPAGTQAQSKPVASALPQTFETSEDLDANGAWNNLQPRLTRPQVVTDQSTAIYLAGLSPNLRPNDPLLIGAETPVLRRIATVEVQTVNKRTLVTLQAQPTEDGARLLASAEVIVSPVEPVSTLRQSVSIVGALDRLPAKHPASSERLQRKLSTVFAASSDTGTAMLKTLFPRAGSQMYDALRNARVASPPASQVAAVRVQATPFGSNAPQKPITTSDGAVIGSEEWPIGEVTSITITLAAAEGEHSPLASVIARFESASRARAGSTVTIGQGAASATGEVPIGSADQTPKIVGASSVTATSTEGAITWTITQPARTFKLVRKMVDNVEHAEVTVDAATQPIVVAQGQSASVAGGGGQRTTVSYGRTLVISDTAPSPTAQPDVLDLDGVYDHILPDSWVVIERADTGKSLPVQVKSTQRVAVSRYNLSAKVTRLTLKQDWLRETDVMLSAIRNTTVLAQADVLPLAEEPVTGDISGDTVELDNVYEGLATGRWLIVQGTRTDIPRTGGVEGAELVMLAGVTQSAAPPETAGTANPAASATAPGATPAGTIRTSLQFASKLAYTYERGSVSIAGNVVEATHGMSRSESLGSGNSSQALQQFSLHQGPLTYVAASTPRGAASTLSVTVNDLFWSEVDSLDQAGPKDRVYVTERDEQEQTSILFGDGVHGLRLPTGTANVAASYRAGLGTGGNLPANQISLLASKPAGVRSVTNPIASAGGADRESIDDARANAPLTVTALDRLVSVEDYADFARGFAGVGKAASASLSNGRQQVVSVTVAGTEAGGLDASSALMRLLAEAFAEQGDPYQPVDLGVCESMLLILSAAVRCLPGFEWESVAGAIRSALLATFGFAGAEIGQSIPLSQVTSAIQTAPGVLSVYVTAFDAISQTEAASPAVFAQRLGEISEASKPRRFVLVEPPRFDPSISAIAPGQVAFFSTELPDTLILTEVTA